MDIDMVGKNREWLLDIFFGGACLVAKGLYC
jgi:hypothetical protein